MGGSREVQERDRVAATLSSVSEEDFSPVSGTVIVSCHTLVCDVASSLVGDVSHSDPPPKDSSEPLRGWVEGEERKGSSRLLPRGG